MTSRPEQRANTTLETLPDYLRPGLHLVFVGLNPSTVSVREGHYFANPRNRFWSALNQSGILPMEVAPVDDGCLIDHGIGFTDLIKRPTSQASGLTAADYRQGAPVLKEKLQAFQPKLVCFHGMMCYRAYLRYAEQSKAKPELGLRDLRIGASEVFVVPNPSPANAQFSLEDLASWYRQLAKWLPGSAA